MLKRCIAVLCLSLFAASALQADEKTKKLLLITDSGGFVHDSVGLAEKLLTELGPKYGWEVTCFRYTRDPEAVGKFEKRDEKGQVVKEAGTNKPLMVERKILDEYAERFEKITKVPVDKAHIGRINKQTLANFDAILFFTTGNPMTKEETKELVEWVKAGHGYAGTHCATDTLYNEPEYGELVGGYFNSHPWHQKIKLVVEDAKHPAGAPFAGSTEITDEIYQFKTPYSRERLHIILSVDVNTIDLTKKDVKRTDKDFAVSWCHEVGKGKAFYTSLGHRKEVWSDPRFQKHLFGGLDWAVGRIAADATPSLSKR
ncbi:ThuA domain-containing protein [Telmatocola sphagniphila]|uniref:ThuA domain-containing protein n=1 Tax=Telmatocola sphagniphila TaxID=1123043 RepID=A0A8E6BAC4_9BACT|nr:ThuA domain-containing protein [Telmatocola sphagniphila]QVL33320.1 ThuA domain-containing protein [Telmatocola sphagniphila]